MRRVRVPCGGDRHVITVSHDGRMILESHGGIAEEQIAAELAAAALADEVPSLCLLEARRVLEGDLRSRLLRASEWQARIERERARGRTVRRLEEWVAELVEGCLGERLEVRLGDRTELQEGGRALSVSLGWIDLHREDGMTFGRVVLLEAAPARRYARVLCRVRGRIREVEICLGPEPEQARTSDAMRVRDAMSIAGLMCVDDAAASEAERLLMVIGMDGPSAQEICRRAREKKIIRANRSIRKRPPTLAERMEEVRRQRVLEAYAECGFRRARSRWVGGKHEVHVVVVDDDAEACAESRSERVWHHRRCWSGTNSTHTLRVSRRVLRLPADQLVGRVGGKRALLLGICGDDVIVATQGRGTALATVRVPREKLIQDGGGA